MGDSYEISAIACAKCGKDNHDVYYAESSDATKFTCEFCKAVNYINLGFHARLEE